MNGADYTAAVRLSTLANETLAEPGETCERVPAASLGWLADQGLITPKPKAAAVRRRGRDEAQPSDPGGSVIAEREQEGK